MDTLTEIDKEIVAISEAISDQPTAQLFVERSKLYFKSQLYSEALEDATSAIKDDPKYTDAYVAAGKATQKLKKFMASYEYYNAGLQFDPKNIEIADDLRHLQNIIIAENEQYSSKDVIPEKSYNAVQLCSQDVYPGDNELFILEVEILAKKYKIDAKEFIKPVQVDMKTRKNAAAIAVMAYNAREDGKLQEALQSIQVALEKDGTNSGMLQIRAQILRDMGEDRKALQDVISIPKPHRVADAWKLGGKCFKE